MGQKHIHAELIKAWADGAEIEVMLFNGAWIRAPFPMWDHDIKFRIKPQPKPDIGVVALVSLHSHGALLVRTSEVGGFINNVRFVFAADTQKLKAVEML